MDKKAAEPVLGQVIFIVLNILFASILILFLVRTGSGALETEQEYAKKIALLVDMGKPGTLIVMDVSEAVEIAKKNKVNEGLFSVDETKRKIQVKLSRYKGYEFSYFSDVNVEINLSENKLSMKLT